MDAPKPDSGNERIFSHLVLGDAIQTGLELKSSVLEAAETQCFHLMSVLNFIIYKDLKHRPE